MQTADFTDRNTARISHYQYDYGQSVEVIGTGIQAGQVCQWSYRGIAGVDSREIESVGADLVVAIPDAALQQAERAHGYIYSFDATSGQTLYEIILDIKPRASTDDIASADEVTYIGALVDAIEAAIENFEIPVASVEVLGGVKVGEHLQITEGVLAVETASVLAADNESPVTSAAVYAVIGDIETALAAI